MNPSAPSPAMAIVEGSGVDVVTTCVPRTSSPAVVPNENVADAIVVLDVIPAPVIVNVADS
jgi:hypothetical protein